MCVFGAGFVGLLFYHDLPWPKTLPSLFSDRLLDNGSNALVPGALTTDQRGSGFTRILDAADANTTDTVDIGAYEAHPSVEDVADQSINEDGSLNTSFNVGDIDFTSGIDTITVSSSNTTLVPNANINVGGTGTNSISNSANGNQTLVITPAANQFGTTTITLTATDTVNGSSQSLTDMFVLTVNPVADPPSISAATTNEDAQTSSGLVITRNAVDNTEVTHFKITSITNGALFKNDGTTAIANNDFITFAEANAGLRFTPTANLFSPGTTFSFAVAGATSAGGAGLGQTSTASITVNAVADPPSITSATTNEDAQTSSGLVVTRNAVDNTEVTHFKITSITNGTLFKNNGTTAIANNDFITFAEANAGLRFTPAVNLFSPGTTFSFDVAGATSVGGAGLGQTSTASITVNAVADTPSITSATTNEDVQTSSDLVVSRNAVDGVEVTHFKITSITGGSLFQNDGTTAISNNDFITFAQGNAGLKFTPSLNSNATGHFTVQASTSNVDGGLGGSTVTADITINPIADTPGVTNASTNEDIQSTSGLVISRNAADGAEVTHFKITSITGGSLFQNDGTTGIAANEFITFAQANAGLKFTPSLNSNATGHFTVQASTSNVDGGLGGSTVTADITINPIADTPGVTNVSTSEDIQSTSGLVISRNAADGTEVTHFKITSIIGGSLFQNDGTTAIAANEFITFAQANAGLKFTPSLNSLTTGHFTVQASTSNVDGGLGGSTVTADITINPIADTPSVSNASTTLNTQTTTGLQISRNVADSAEVTHFKITNITGGSLFQNDGTTPIADNDFITFAEGNAGLKFTPALNSITTGHFTVQASLSNLDGGLGGSLVTSDIIIVVADLSITKSVTPGTTAPGTTISYTLSFSNTGETAATGVVISDSIPLSVTVTGITSSTVGSGVLITQTSGAPDFAWDVSDLAVGAGGYITLTGTLTNTFVTTATVDNTATITASNDFTTTNNGGSASVEVGAGLLAYAVSSGSHITVTLVGDFVEIEIDGVVVERRAFALTTGITILGADGSDDTLVVDFSNGNPIPGGGLTFHGGSGGNDSLTLTGDSFGSVTHNFSSASDGSVVLDGSTIIYTGLEPIFDNLPAIDRLFDFTGADETITLSDDANPDDGASFIDSTLGESVTFANPSNSLTVATDAGSGNDVVNVAALDGNFAAALLFASDGTDTVNFTANPAPVGLTSLDVLAGSIGLAADITSSDGQVYTGTLTVSASITLTASEIDFRNGSNSVQNSGAVVLTLAPVSAAASIVIGGSSDSGGAVLDITDSDLAALQDGFAGIVIGRGDGTGQVTVESSAFSDEVTIVGGDVELAGHLNANLNNARLTAQTGIISGGGNSPDITGNVIFSGTLAPGASPGQLIVAGNVTLGATDTFSVEIAGTTAATEYDQLQVTGSNRVVTLNGATLDLTLLGGFVPSPGDRFTVIDNVADSSGVVDFFAGFPENAIFALGGQQMYITYFGGNGLNDLVLTACSDAITVLDGGDSGADTLRQAIADICPGGTITIDPNFVSTVSLTSIGDTFNGDSALGIYKPITIIGNEAWIERDLAAPEFRIFYVESSAALTLTQATVSNGLTSAGGDRNGGGIFSYGDLTLINSSVYSNSAAFSGGGIFMQADGESHNFTLQDSQIISNSAGIGDFGGGGIYVSTYSTGQITVTIERSSINRNVSGSGGGGLHLGIEPGGAATFAITDTEFISNIDSDIDSFGGGISLHADSSNMLEGSINRSLLAQNSSQNNGGGIGIGGPGTLSVRLINTTISGNFADNNGGGVYLESGTVEFHNVTVTDNTADGDENNSGDGGGLADSGSSTTLYNTLVTDNFDLSPTALITDTSGVFTGTHNLIGDGSGGSGLTDGFDGNQVGSSASPIVALLGPLQDNGGATFTHALLTGSPAIDQGKDGGDSGATTSEDQRAELRPADQAGIANASGGDGSDIGAFELQLPLCFTEYTGDNATDFSSVDAQAVQDAIDAATAGDEVLVAGYCLGVQSRAGMDQTAYIDKELTLRGGYTVTNWLTSDPVANPTTLDADGLGRVVVITDTVATVENLQITNADINTGGGGIFDDSGGGIFAAASTATISNSLIYENFAAEGGGGLFNLNGVVLVYSSVFEYNSAPIGGGIGSAGVDGAAALTVTGASLVQYNVAFGGGGLFNQDGALYVADSIIQFNEGDAGGGGILSYWSGGTLTSTLVVTDGTQINENFTFGEGGGILNDVGVATVTGSSLYANEADSGGGGFSNLAACRRKPVEQWRDWLSRQRQIE